MFTHSNDERNVVFIYTSNKPSAVIHKAKENIQFIAVGARRHAAEMCPKSKSRSPEIQRAPMGLPRPKTNKFKEVRMSFEVPNVFHETELTCSG